MHCDVESELKEAMSDTVQRQGRPLASYLDRPVGTARF